MSKQAYVFLEPGDVILATDEAFSRGSWFPASEAFVGEKYEDWMSLARRTAHDAQAECGKSSGEAVGEITHSSFEGWYFHPYINWPEIGDGTKLYAAPQHSADIDAMRAHLTASSRDTWIRLSGRPMIEGSLAHAFAVWLIDAAIDAALQAKGVAE